MKEQFLAFVRKEWFHIWRDKKTLFILFGLPVVQIIIFGFALTNEIKNARIAVVDRSRDALSQQYIQRIEASRYFDIESMLGSANEADAEFRKGKIKLVVVIPENFGSDIRHQNKTQVQVIADVSDPNTGTTLGTYIQAITADFQSDINQGQKLPYTIQPEVRMLYNPQLKGAYNFVPGVMAMVLMLICTLMTSIAIVKEKETGTMEVLLVSPLKPVLVILAKSTPYLLLSAVNIVSILLLSVFVLGLPIAGNLALLIGLSLLFTITSLSFGMLISSITASQQTAMLISLMGLFLPTLMLSGFMFPIENMPLPLKVMSNLVPAKWYFFIVKAVMIKGVGMAIIWKETLILTVMTIVFLALSIRKYNIRLANH
ncbi:MAG: ABC transporter permease [Bacteroidia bacterium]|nr:ABC transporter permease [Bacteroidia bacterium]